MKKIIHILIILALNIGFLSSNTGKDKFATKTIAGKITDNTGEPIAGAKISIEETGEIVYTDFEGNYKFTLKLDKDYAIHINNLGFELLTLRSSKLSPLQNHTLQSL